MINQKLLVSGADYFADTYEINPYYTQNKIDVNKAMAEHKLILDCFKEANIELVKVKPPKNCQDGVYTANWALIKDNIAVMSRLPKARKAEENYARKILEQQGIKTVLVPGKHLFSGQGDSLRCGKYLFGGCGYRSDPEAQQFAADTLGLELIQLHAKPQLNPDGSEHINPVTNHADSFWYDIDLAVSVIDDHTIAYCPDALDDQSNQKLQSLNLDTILVDYEECTKGFANNLVSTGKHVIMSNKAPKLQSALEKRGLICLTPDVTELKKGGGYIRCVSLWLS
ncbi:MAG: amidinotransferase [Candidatus Saccharibacteria bacterium]|nr:amidinotransferase [Candidatus Saccharibacteria bacterium]